MMLAVLVEQPSNLSYTHAHRQAKGRLPAELDVFVSGYKFRHTFVQYDV